MKKTISFAVCVLLLLFSSCSYIADYPDTYTPEYCYKNYVSANPNLQLTFDTKIAENPVGREGMIGHAAYHSYRYHGIKGIPIDEYMMEIFATVYGSEEHLAKNKSYSKDPIFDYNVISAEIAWRGSENHISVANIDVNVIKNLICEAIKNEEFSDINNQADIIKEYTPPKTFFNIEPKTDKLFLGIEIVFSEYENLFWRGTIQKDEDNYYVTCYIESGKGVEIDSRANILYDPVYIALPEDISSIIAEIDVD